MNYRTLIFSDTHLGCKNNISILIKFLTENEFEYIYINGDFIDGISLQLKWNWDAQNNVLIQKLLKKARHGTKIVLTVGNHDLFLNNFKDHDMGNISIKEFTEHTTLKGERILIFHGHILDLITKYNKFFHILGAKLFNLATYLSIGLSKLRYACPWIKAFSKYYSFHNVGAIEIKKFENNACEMAKLKGFTSVLVSHFHHPDVKEIDGIKYYNSGNCVDRADCIIETVHGDMKLLDLFTKTANF